MKFDEEVCRYLKEFAPSSSAAVTLTMKQRDNGVRLDKVEAKKNFRYFANILSRRAFGSKYSRFGRRIEALPIFETSLSGRLHYHVCLENPFEDIVELKTEVFLAWRKTRWGHSEIDVKPMYSDGWVDYITKSGRYDDIDYENMHKVR